MGAVVAFLADDGTVHVYDPADSGGLPLCGADALPVAIQPDGPIVEAGCVDCGEAFVLLGA